MRIRFILTFTACAAALLAAPGKLSLVPQVASAGWGISGNSAAWETSAALDRSTAPGSGVRPGEN